MASNPNGSLVGKHCLYMAQTSSGKSLAVNEAVKGEKRVVYWDPDEDYKVEKRFTSLSGFAKYLLKHAEDEKLSVALSVADVSKKAFDIFNQCVWLIADSKYETHVVWEELSDVSDGNNLGNYGGQIIRKGRKYALVIHGATQRPQNIPKVLFAQCKRKWVGYQDEYDHKYIAANTGIPIEIVADIKPLGFITKEVNTYHRGKFSFEDNVLSVDIKKITNDNGQTKEPVKKPLPKKKPRKPPK